MFYFFLSELKTTPLKSMDKERTEKYTHLYIGSPAEERTHKGRCLRVAFLNVEYIYVPGRIDRRRLARD